MSFNTVPGVRHTGRIGNGFYSPLCLTASLFLAVLLPLTAEDTPPTPPPAAETQPPAATPDPAAAGFPTLPADVTLGASRLRLKSGGTPTVESLMLHNERWYGKQNGVDQEYPRDDVVGVESNAPAEANLKQGAAALAAETAVLRNDRIYFSLGGDARAEAPAAMLTGLYPAGRDNLYPALFGKFIAPWGKAYAQRPFFLQVDLGYVYTKGVVENQVANAHLLVGSDIQLWRFRLEAVANYGETEGIITVNNQSGELKVDRYVMSWMYGYAKTGLLHDDIALIRYRSTQGVGVGLGTFDLSGWLGAWVQSQYKAHNFDFEIGIEHLNEKDKNAYKEGWFARLAMIDTMRFVNGMEFDNKVEYLPALSNNLQADKGQYFIYYRSAFRMNLASSLALRLAYNLDYNSKPPLGSPSATHQLSVTLGYTIG